MSALSIMAGMGLAILLVEKGDHGPLKPVTAWLRKALSRLPYVGKTAPEVLDCAVCASFWTTLLTDALVGLFTHNYFAWPLSGFVAAGTLWVIYETLKTVDGLRDAIKGISLQTEIEEEGLGEPDPDEKDQSQG